MSRVCGWVTIGVLIFGISPVAWAAGDAATGQKNYQAYCTMCHGQSGKGDGSGAAALATKPKDFTDCARMQAMSDEDLFAVIKGGGPARQLSLDMPSWGEGLQDAEITDLVAYIRSFCQR